jgi:malate dehydrogenase (oxaloacetate-decarboxylating)
VALASVLSACRSNGVNRKKAVIGQMGLGAAGLAICHMLMAYGVKEVYGIGLPTRSDRQT